MFCPSCGFEDRQPNQYCRACGTDLRNVRAVLEKPDAVTAAAALAREEIGRAIAAKIRATESLEEISEFAEEGLPEIEKFLESPGEKRLRRIRAGVVTASVGVGVTLLLLGISLVEGKDLFLPAAGLLVFFIGLGIIINGFLFTIPGKAVADNSPAARRQRELERDSNPSGKQINEYQPPIQNPFMASVTEHTTNQLSEKEYRPE